MIFLWIAAESLVLFRQAVPKEAWQLATWLKGGLQIAAALVLWGYLGSFFGLEGIGWLFWLAAGLAAAGALLGNLAAWLQPRSLPGSDGMAADPIDNAPKLGNTTARFQIFRGRDSQYYFRLLGHQGAIILASEGYTTRVSCVKGIQSVQKNATIDDRYQRRTASNGERYFVLQAGNRQIIGTSETFADENDLENEIRNVQELAAQAEVEDLT